MGFSSFRSKFPSRCRECGKSICVDDRCYGKKDDGAGKWFILCPECYKKMEEKRGEMPPEDALPNDGVNLKDAPTDRQDDKSGSVNKPRRKLSFEEQLKANAPWYIEAK